jgi:phosphatidylglycerol:prolipoprotein diacylglycerol transferase
MLFDNGTISFPGLGIDGINPPRTLPFTIFGRSIYLYGLIIALGFLLGILYLRKRAKDFGTNFDLITDAILFAVPAAIICARIYYVAFRWNMYKDDPISALYIWEGGIAIYGGVIGAILGLLLFAKVKKQKLTPYLDLMALGLLIGQCIGRWGNFFNREAYGAAIQGSFFLRMGIEELGGRVNYWHPTFLYESLWNLVGFLLLHRLSKKRKYDGQTFLQYLAWYGLGRAWIEGLRTDSLYIGSTGLRVSQLLAAVSFVAAVGVMLYIKLYKNPDGSGMLVNQATGDKAEETGLPAAEDEAEEAELPAAEDEAEEAGLPAAEDEAEEAGLPAAEDEAEEAGLPAAEDEAEEAGLPAEEDEAEARDAASGGPREASE